MGIHLSQSNQSWGTEFSIQKAAPDQPLTQIPFYKSEATLYLFLFTDPSLDYKYSPIPLEEIFLKCFEWYGSIPWHRNTTLVSVFKIAVVLFWYIKLVGRNSSGSICANNVRSLLQISSLKTPALSPTAKGLTPLLLLTGVFCSTRYNVNHLRCQLLIFLHVL